MRPIDATTPLLLASASPRRREILETLRIPLVVAPSAVDETPLAGEPPAAYLARVTHDKLLAALASPAARVTACALVADTSVVVDGEVLGKPRDEAEAATMIARLSGRTHEVMTRFSIGAVADGTPRALAAETVVTRVTFRALDAREIAAYAATGEGLDKAGAYAAQGVGSFAIARIEGSYSCVVGLPASEVVAALVRVGALVAYPP